MKQKIEFGYVYTLKKHIDYSQGVTVSKILTKNKNGSTTLFFFDKRKNQREQTTPFDDIAIFLKSKCEITIGGKPNLLFRDE
jgi:hypothetical protein|tara:strand:- start:2529 stop:2774 length:246 start_codon:yes stop_codon:yes gene_type:complete